MLLETVTYRISGHSPSDASSYRSKEEIERWQQADPILRLQQMLTSAGLATDRRARRRAQQTWTQ